MDLLNNHGTFIILFALVGCIPDVDTDESIVLRPRLLALAATPAEAAPSEAITFTALVGSADGALDDATLDWARCQARASAAEPGIVSSRCLDGDTTVLLPIGAGLSVTDTVPMDACARFGPEPPRVEPGQPAARPADPDISGGYRQPLIIRGPEPGLVSTFEQRLRCGLAGASPADAARFRQMYHPNTNPAPTLLVMEGGNIPDEPDQRGVVTARPEAQLQLQVSWPACPDDPAALDAAGCGGAEPYLRFDPEAQTFTTPREALRLSWLATAPGLALERTGVRADDPATTSTNTFTAPSTPGVVHLWVVLRDSRGGVGWTSLTLRIAP